MNFQTDNLMTERQVILLLTTPDALIPERFGTATLTDWQLQRRGDLVNLIATTWEQVFKSDCPKVQFLKVDWSEKQSELLHVVYYLATAELENGIVVDISSTWRNY